MTIKTKVGKISLVKNCIVRVEGNPDIHIELEDMFENDKAFKKILKGKKDAPFLVIFGENAGISEEARTYFGNKERSQIKRAEALVTPQLHHKLIAKSHLYFRKPSYPTKIFSNEKEALKWLKQFCDTRNKINPQK